MKVRVELWNHKPDTHTIVLKKTNGWRGSCTFFKVNLFYEFELSLNLNTEKRKICITVHSWITVRVEIPYTNLNVSSDWSSFKNPDQKVIDQIQRQLDKAKKSKPKSQVEIIRNQVLVEDLSYLLCNDRNAIKKALDQAKTDANSGQAGADVLLALGVTAEAGAGGGVFVGAGIWGAYGSESGFDCGLYLTTGYEVGYLFGASMQGMLSIVGRDNNIAGKNAVEMFRSPYKFAKVSGGEGIVFSVCFYFGEEGISGTAFGMGVGVGWPLNVYARAGLTFIVVFLARRTNSHLPLSSHAVTEKNGITLEEAEPYK